MIAHALGEIATNNWLIMKSCQWNISRQTLFVPSQSAEHFPTRFWPEYLLLVTKEMD